jgi:polyphenol oxidase
MNVFRFEKLLGFRDIAHGVSTKDVGTMKNEDSTVSQSGIKRFLKFLNLSEEAVCMKQVHGGDVAVVKDKIDFQISSVDGLITNIKNIPLLVFVADCLPILFYDPRKGVVGVGHAGRKGLQSGVIKNIIEKYKSEFGSSPEDIIVGIGPGIEKKCYKVDGELLDIREIANEQLLSEDIKNENIENMDICTKCNMDKFYSYRGGDKDDRFAAVISMI